MVEAAPVGDWKFQSTCNIQDETCSRGERLLWHYHSSQVSDAPILVIALTSSFHTRIPKMIMQLMKETESSVGFVLPVPNQKCLWNA